MLKMRLHADRSSALTLQMMANVFGMKVLTFDNGTSVQAFTHEAALAHQLKKKYGVRFLPKQVVRRELTKGFNPFSD